MSTATDKLNAVQVWSQCPKCGDTGISETSLNIHGDIVRVRCDCPIGQREIKRPPRVPQVILDVLTAKPKPTRKPRK